MKTAVFFALLIGAPLLYLWQHAYGFRLCQRIAKIEDQKQHAREVNDSLQACLASLASRHGVETRARELGLESKAKLGSIIVPAVAVQPTKAPKPVAATAKPKTPTSLTVVAGTKKPGAKAPGLASSPKALASNKGSSSEIRLAGQDAAAKNMLARLKEGPGARGCSLATGPQPVAPNVR